MEKHFYFITWTFVANYGDKPAIVLASCAKEAVDRAYGFFHEDVVYTVIDLDRGCMVHRGTLATCPDSIDAKPLTTWEHARLLVPENDFCTCPKEKRETYTADDGVSCRRCGCQVLADDNVATIMAERGPDRPWSREGEVYN